ncbi:MAG: hypothetical protein Q8P16_00265 [bacterium]|nr:hypothetical protein [bacterium]
MRTLSGFLHRYLHIKPPEKTVRNAFVKAVYAVTGIELPREQCVVRQKSVTINAPSAIKHEIRLHQQEILEHIGEATGDPYVVTAIY